MTAKSQRLPKFRIHKFTQQAYVELSGRRFYLGLHHTPEARQRYNALVADWLANGRKLRVSPQEITVKELIARYWLFAEKYYRDPDGNVSRELDNIRDAMRPVKELYGETLAKDFGP
ncbi:MAG: recombinase XerD, partial [Phycisphaerae bacterium]|nr:recombinase XerD [Phycisphaerae bacterium]